VLVDALPSGGSAGCAVGQRPGAHSFGLETRALSRIRLKKSRLGQRLEVIAAGPWPMKAATIRERLKGSVVLSTLREAHHTLEHARHRAGQRQITADGAYSIDRRHQLGVPTGTCLLVAR
jgi:hypothetical protein